MRIILTQFLFCAPQSHRLSRSREGGHSGLQNQAFVLLALDSRLRGKASLAVRTIAPNAQNSFSKFPKMIYTMGPAQKQDLAAGLRQFSRSRFFVLRHSFFALQKV
jgi:hypothetical protein